MTSSNTHNYPTHFPRRSSQYVANMKFSADVDRNGRMRMELGQPVVAAAAGIINAQSIAATLTKSVAGIVAAFNPKTMMGKYGRNVTVVLSGAGAVAATVFGKDYLGQPMSETFTTNGTTPVVGKKAFFWIDSLSCALVAATTINVGYGTVLGIPYAVGAFTAEYLNGVAATAGTKVVAVLTAQTATSGDPRGTYDPNSAPDGSRDFVLEGYAIEGDYHGLPHFTS